MTKADLITIITDKLGLPWLRAELVVDEVFSSLSKAILRGEGTQIRGFGTFSVRQYGAYEGHNPRTGKVVRVKPKRRALFKVSKELCEKVNRGR